MNNCFIITDILSKLMQAAMEHAFPGQLNTFTATVTETANPEFGDYQCNDAMSLAKLLKKKPRDVASELLNALPENAVISKTDIAGPGFINLTLSPDWLVGKLDAISSSVKLGVPDVGEGKTIVIDYSSPNVAKPMHIGHIRSTIIGNSIDKMHRYLGYKVVSDNHLGDWGTQFGIIIMGYRHFVDKQALQDSPVEELERVYVASYKKTEDDEEWKNQCRKELVKLQAGDPENLRLWKEFVDISMREFERIYNRLGVSFDLVRGESYYNPKLKGVVEELKGKGIAKESEGAMVVFLEEEKLPVCIVRKSDEGFNYATTDIATIESRVGEFSPAKIIYVTDERQQLHFKQIFAICRRIGVNVPLDHVWFGLMRLPEGTFSTRQGNVIKLESLLDEAVSRAKELARQSSPDTSEEQLNEVAKVVGIGAVKYADLSQNPQTTITFTWDKAMALNGNSGPYLQYAYARIASVIDKYRDNYPDKDLEKYPINLTERIERDLAIRLIRFPDIVIRAAHSYKPSMIADYLFDLAQTYSSFYQNVPFLKAEEGVRESRVRLCALVSKVLKKGLDLLGIGTLDRI